MYESLVRVSSRMQSSGGVSVTFDSPHCWSDTAHAEGFLIGIYMHLPVSIVYTNYSTTGLMAQWQGA
jgi:hypothetical protein